MASTCPPCIQEIEELKEVWETYGDEVTIISISILPSVDTPESLAKLAEKHSAEWTFAIDSTGSAKMAAFVTRIPRILILDPFGSVVFDHAGFVDSSILIREIRAVMEYPTAEPVPLLPPATQREAVASRAYPR